MKVVFSFFFLFFSCWYLNAQEDYVTMRSGTSNWGYVVSADNQDEIGMTDIRISDLSEAVKNYVTMNYWVSSSAYVVGAENQRESGMSDIRISDLSKVVENLRKNPIMVNSNFYSSGYLVGVANSLWDTEIGKTDIRIEDLLDLMKDVEDLKDSFEALKDENESLKKKIDKLEDRQTRMADFVGFAQSEEETLSVSNQVSGNIKAFVDEKTIMLENIQGLPVTVYHINGTLLTQKSTMDHTVSIEVPSTGIYIVLAGEEVLKIVVP